MGGYITEGQGRKGKGLKINVSGTDLRPPDFEDFLPSGQALIIPKSLADDLGFVDEHLL